jgi:hypothetical protein
MTGARDVQVECLGSVFEVTIDVSRSENAGVRMGIGTSMDDMSMGKGNSRIQMDWV